jgi:hypothetical protein
MLGVRLVSVLFITLPTVAVLTVHATPVEAESKDCRAKPGTSAPPGSNWHYRVDRVGQRRCWFLSSDDPRVHTLVGRTNSLAHREPSGTTAADIKQQSVADREAGAEEDPRSVSVALLHDQMDQELAEPVSDASTPQALAPHKVLTTHAQPRAAKQSVGPGTDLDLIFLFGALATTLLIAGGAFQAVGQIQRILFNRNKIKEYCAPFPPQGDVAQVPLNDTSRKSYSDAMAETLIFVSGAGPTTVPQSREDNLTGLDLGAPNLHRARSSRLLLSLLR